nr:MAG: hypothetical protein EDM05_31545 [Leptolyngbya sp. IPPAS B-1204]
MKKPAWAGRLLLRLLIRFVDSEFDGDVGVSAVCVSTGITSAFANQLGQFAAAKFAAKMTGC